MIIVQDGAEMFLLIKHVQNLWWKMILQLLVLTVAGILKIITFDKNFTGRSLID